MIRYMFLRNFFSFRGETLLDLRASAKTPTDDSFAPSMMNDQVSVLTGVFGPNAAGKTNLLKGLAFLNFFLRNSYEQLEEGAQIPIDTFFMDGEDPAELKIEFEGGGEVYQYEVKLTMDEIQSERLLLRHPQTRSFRTVLKRHAAASGPTLQGDGPFGKLDAMRKLLRDRPNASMLAVGRLTGQAAVRNVFDALGPLETNVSRLGKTQNNPANDTEHLFRCAKYFQENPQFEEDLSEYLRNADLGISTFEIQEIDIMTEKGETIKKAMPYVTHKSGSRDFHMPLLMESSGTKRLFVLLRSFLPVLTEGGIAVIDEMESDMHPHLVPLLLNLFRDRETNPKRAQLVFTCHHVEILNELSKEQIVLVEKDEDNVSHATRLDGIKGVRREENFFANYNAGRYAAVPEPELF